MPTSAVLSFKLVGSCNLIVCSNKFNIWVMFDMIYPKAQNPPLAGSLISFRPGEVADFDKGQVFPINGFSSPGFPGLYVRWPTKSSGISLTNTAGGLSQHSLVFPTFKNTRLVELAGPNVKWPPAWKDLLVENAPYGPYVCSYVNALTAEMTAKLNAIPTEGNLQFRSVPIQFSWPAGAYPIVTVKGCSSNPWKFGPASATIAAGVQPSVRSSQLFRLNKEYGLDVGPWGNSTIMPATYVEKNVTVQLNA
jgi:hypothetical protein